MNKTNKGNFTILDKSLIDTPELQKILSCGRVTALEIGNNAQARVQIGRRVLWNVRKVNKYLDAIAE